jgi:hypothetical protein
MGYAAFAGWLVWVLMVSFTVLWLVDVVVRRLLPLQRLLQLCLVFPDRAPSRLRIAVRAARPRRPEALLVEATQVPSGATAAAEHIVGLLAALAVHDRRTRGHSERVAAYTTLLADQMHLTQVDRDRLTWVALVHDIGKLEVPRRLLNKPGKPTVQEWKRLQQHPVHGNAIIAPLREWFGPWADSVMQHHERYDGGGYPQGLAGEEICLGARIITVTDAFEVMTAPRPYRRPVDAQDARAELARQAGTQFDPVVVRQFLAIGLPELRRSMGLLALLGQLPFLRDWPRLQAASAVTTSRGIAVASTAGAVALGASAVAPVATEAGSAGGDRGVGHAAVLGQHQGLAFPDSTGGVIAVPAVVGTEGTWAASTPKPGSPAAHPSTGHGTAAPSRRAGHGTAHQAAGRAAGTAGTANAGGGSGRANNAQRGGGSSSGTGTSVATGQSGSGRGTQGRSGGRGAGGTPAAPQPTHHGTGSHGPHHGTGRSGSPGESEWGHTHDPSAWHGRHPAPPVGRGRGHGHGP